MSKKSDKINLCYGAFLKILASFNKKSINNWQLHNRLLNIEFVPFGDSNNKYSVGTKPLRFDKNLNEYVEISNPFAVVSGFMNCTKPQRLPIQGTKSEKRFIEQFLKEEARQRILDYMERDVLRYLDNNNNILIKALIEMLSLSNTPEALKNEPFYIDVDPAIQTMKNEIVDSRTDLYAPAFIAGVFQYILVHCPDNTVGNALFKDESGKSYGTKIEDWGKSVIIPNGDTVEREIYHVSDNSKPSSPSGNAPPTNTVVHDAVESVPEHEPQIQYRNDFYNLFIIDFYDPDEPISQKEYFFVERVRILSEYITDEPKSLFTPLNQETISQIKRLPSIFACENRLGDCPKQKAYYGFVTDIKEREDGVNVYFKIEQTLSQRKLNDIAQSLAISKLEFTRTHWTIKKLDLVEELVTAKVLPPEKPQGLIDFSDLRSGTRITLDGCWETASIDSPDLHSGVRIALIGCGEVASSIISDISASWKDCPTTVSFASVVLGSSPIDTDELRGVIKNVDLILLALSSGVNDETVTAAIEICKKAQEAGSLVLVFILNDTDGRVVRTDDDALMEELFSSSSSYARLTSDNKNTAYDAHRSLRKTAQNFFGLINTAGIINLDFADVRTVLAGGRRMYIGFGSASGENRAYAAVAAAADRPITLSNLGKSDNLLICITYNEDCGMCEIIEISDIVKQRVTPDAAIIMGVIFSQSPSSNIEVMLIASEYVGSRENTQSFVHSISATDIKISNHELSGLARQKNITMYDVDPDNPKLLSMNGALLAVKTHSVKYKLLKVPPATNGEYEVDENVDEIGSLCFAGCEKITQIIIPDSVVYIHNSAFVGCAELRKVVFMGNKTYIQENAFEGCDGLREVTVYGGITGTIRKAMQKISQIKITEMQNGREL